MPTRHRLAVAFPFALAVVHAWQIPTALATFSIVTVNQETGEAGAAGASCVGFDIAHAFALEPGRAVVAQAYYFDAGKLRAAELLRGGLSPKEALAQITAHAFDPDSARRQYGLVSAGLPPAAFTGTETDSVSAHRVGTFRQRSFAAQGNYLTSDRVVIAAERVMLTGTENLADILMKAIEAGASKSEGDARCRSFGIPATAAFLSTKGRGGESVLISVVVRDGTSAVVELRRRYDAWRTAHPKQTSHCTARPPQRSSAMAAPFAVAFLTALAIRRRRLQSRHS